MIYYAHDGSESATDSFTVRANDTGLRKHSVGQTLYIQLTAVNDEPPVITANRVLRVGRPAAVGGSHNPNPLNYA